MSNLVSIRPHIIEVSVTPDMFKKAQEEAHRGSMNGRSMLGGSRNVEGLLGELAVHSYLPMLTHEPTDHYDFTARLKSGTLTVDVKNKFDVKREGFKPGLDWDCTIFGYEANKNCHLYLFTSTNGDNTKVWLKGYIMKKRLVTSESFYAAGSFRKTTQGSVRYREDNYVVQVKDLSQVGFLKNRLIEITQQQDQTDSVPQEQP